MLFKVSDTRDFKEINPSCEAIAELWRLTSRQLLAIALTADYDSPLRLLPEKRRREEAAKIAGYKYEADGKRPDKNMRSFIDGQVPTIEVGIAKYRELQYDEDSEMLQAVSSQIQDILRILQMDKEQACTIKETKKDKNGEKTVTEYVDFEKVAKLSEQAIKLSSKLIELKKTKTDLINVIAAKADSKIDVVTYTSADLNLNSDDNESLSVLDQFMAAKTENK